MSGTSVDGVDCAIANITGSGHRLRFKLVHSQTIPYKLPLRKRILSAITRGTGKELCHLNVVLAEVFAHAALKTIKKAGLTASDISLIGSHGQTMYHCPNLIQEAEIGRLRSTFQIGEPAVIAERTGITTVANFRARDLAAGGQGAPLTPYVHFLTFRNRASSRLVVNLGGIANITYLAADGDLADIQAFDTGPCNMLLDGLVYYLTGGKQTVDRNGRLARRGTINHPLLKNLMKHPYLRKVPPKTTGREEFGNAFVTRIFQLVRKQRLSPEDALATCCRFIALSIFQASQWLKDGIDEIVVGGGGVANQMLMAELRIAFATVRIRTMDEEWCESKAFEAMAFAILAYQTWHGVSTNVPSATGAKHSVILGSIVPGEKTDSPCLRLS